MEKEEEERQATVPLLTKQLDSIVISSSENGGSSGRGSDRHLTAVLVCSTFVSACGAFNYGFAITFSSPTESGIIADLGLTVAEYSTFGSILTIGGLISAMLCGKITDLIGRKYTTCILVIIYMIGWLVTGLAKSAWMLDLGRLISGFGTGIGSYLVPVYLAELAPSKLRGTLMTFVMLMTGFSMAFVYLIGNLVNWRILALLGTIPCLLECCFLYFIPESPRWLAKNGRIKECEAALMRLRGDNTDILEEAAEITEYLDTLPQISMGGISDLCQHKNAYPFIVGIGLVLLSQLGGFNAYTYYTETIFVSAGISKNVGFTAMAATQILMNVVSVISVDKFGRRPILLVSAAGTFLGSFLTGLSFIIQDIQSHWKEFAPILALTSVLVFMGSFGLGMGGLPWTIISEILPINIKGSAGSICNVVSYLCGFLVSYTFTFLLDLSSAGTFFIFAMINGLGVIFVAKLVPETKGRTLEEIQASFTLSEERI